VLGQFASVDPTTDPDDPQQKLGYTYSDNTPIAFCDPTGLIVDEGCGARYVRCDQTASTPPTSLSGVVVTENEGHPDVMKGLGACASGDPICRQIRSGSKVGYVVASVFAQMRMRASSSIRVPSGPMPSGSETGVRRSFA